MGTKADLAFAGEYNESIHVEGRSTAFDGRETHHEVFESALWTSNYISDAKILPWEDFAMRIGREMQTIGNLPQYICFLLALESLCGNGRE